MEKLRLNMRATVECKFSAAHQLEGLGADHPCTSLHGHNYKVWITFEGEPDELGLIIDFRLVKDVIKKMYDHKNLNEVMPGRNTTAENLSFDVLRVMNDVIFKMQEEERVRVVLVEVQETETSKVRLEVVPYEDA